jgi:hypothetical protein
MVAGHMQMFYDVLLLVDFVDFVAWHQTVKMCVFCGQGSAV